MSQISSIPISIDYSPRRLRAGEKSLLRISLEIPAGFHIIAQSPSEGILIPAELLLESPEGVIIGEPSYPEPYKAGFEWSEPLLLTYKEKVEIDVPIEVAPGKGGRIDIPGILSYQGCNEKQCFPPEKQEFTLRLEVAG